MTFCLGMRVEEGLIAIGDTRITTGSECITARKMTCYQGDGYAFFLMTSGLRSVRDKALTYFDEYYHDMEAPWERLFKVCNTFAEHLRMVAHEDKNYLESSGLQFNNHALIGGQMGRDQEPKLYLVYPQGNWVEVAIGTPYAIIGNSGYGKPVLDRGLQYSDSMRYALKVGCLAFDSTRISAADVDFPVDIALLQSNARKLVSRRFTAEDFQDISNWWDTRLRGSIRELPFARLEEFYDELPKADDKIVSIKGRNSGSGNTT